MEFVKNDLPKIISYFEQELKNPTYPRREAMEFIIRDLKNDYEEFVYESWKKENGESLYEGYEQKLAERGLSTNNGENMDEYDEYCEELFLSELSTTDQKPKYDKIVEAVELKTFNI